jgi:hypothetical protein
MESNLPIPAPGGTIVNPWNALAPHFKKTNLKMSNSERENIPFSISVEFEFQVGLQRVFLSKGVDLAEV